MLEKLEKIKDFQIILLGLLLAIGFVGTAKIATGNLSKDNITVTGSAYKIVTSDSASWEFNLETKAANKKDCYKTVQGQIPVVKNYLKSKGIKETDIELLLPTGYDVYKSGPNGYSTNEVVAYHYTQPIKIHSDNVQKIKDISTDSQTLLEKGIDIGSYNQPQFQYSKLADLKVELLQEATKDAKARANSMLKANHNRVGKIKQAKMGVFQITPPDSTDVSDGGINDSSTIEKKVTAVASVTFSIK